MQRVSPSRFHRDTFRLVLQCFGSQAALCGLLILSAKFSANTFRLFGLAMIPYVAFDYLAWRMGALTPFGALGDLAGNVVFGVCCYQGYRQMIRLEKTK